MKKLFRNLLFLSAIGSVAFLYSCGGDDEVVLPDMPTLDVTASVNDTEVTGTAIEAVLGDVVTFEIDANTPGGFNVVRFSGDITADEVTRVDLGLDAGATSASLDPLTITLEDEELIGTEIEVVITVVDDSDQTAVVTYTIAVSEPPSPDARAYTAVLLYAPLADESSEIFFSTSTGETFSPDAVLATTEPVSGTLDFGYYHGANDGASLASIAAYAELSVDVFAGQVSGFGTKNATVFKETTLNASAFTEVTTWADIDEVFDGITGDGEGILTGLEEGQVIAFQTDADKEGGAKKGLILVKTIEGTFNEGDYIELEILVQEEVED